MKSFKIQVEFDDKYDEGDVLDSIMGQLDISTFDNIGVHFRAESSTVEARKEWLTKKYGDKNL